MKNNHRSVRRTLTIGNPQGLHARPAVKLTKLAKEFHAHIRVAVADGQFVNAKSPNAVMKLKARQGDAFAVEADGDDAHKAIWAIADLVARNFDE
ncbi:MAG TPA: HPr family phosphocarrier protein [Alphaproteobacteria bacterium]|jgi:phosphocarrier protein|nr:HPr family phosphocarrier protein [Alphaproteobacteria bacterium]